MRNRPDPPAQEDTDNEPRLKKRGFVYFPADLKYVASTGTGRFVTRIEHRMPDGTPVVWTSRRHRKARGLKIGEKAEEKPGTPHDRKRAIGAQYLYWGFRPRAISWWVTVFSLLGSIGFFTSSLFGFFGQGPIQIDQE